MDESTPTSKQPAKRPKPSSEPEQQPLIGLRAGNAKALETAKQAKALKTHWPRLERLLAPTSGRFWVVGGRPGNYKTQLVWNLALDLAERRQKVLFVSLEEEAESMSLAATARYSQVPTNRIRLAASDPELLTSQEQEALAAADERLGKLELSLRLHGADEHGRTIEHVIDSACRARFDAVFVDHLGMLAREGRELEELARAVDRLRGLTRGEVSQGYRPFVCATSPLNRDMERDSDEERMPRTSDFRGSGRIESDVDLAMIVQKRKREKSEEEAGTPDQVDGFVLKNRQGICPLVMLFEAHGATCTVTERRPDVFVPPHWQEGDDK